MHATMVVASRALLLIAITREGGLVVGPRALLHFRVAGCLLSAGLQDPTPIAPYPRLEDAPPQLFEGRLHYPDHPPTQDTKLHSVIKEHCKEHLLG